MNAINIPAIRGKIGTLVYYTSSFTFKQIAERVKRIDDELHTSQSLRDQLQRSLTENHVKIKDYILTQQEHFFNALVLAIYDGEPKWNEMEIDFQDQDYYSMGFLQLTGKEKIFPVDGQHRVEGIKKALEVDDELSDETIAVIFIGHSKTDEGMEKTRRIFSTLNRYAKPVNLGDIIALDEDDTVAIVTRELLENYPLFKDNRIKCTSKSKALSEADKTSFTSLITLYDCNREIYKYYKSKKDNKSSNYSTAKIVEFLKYRPKQKDIDDFQEYLITFWDQFCNHFIGMTDFIKSTEKNPAESFRNKAKGGLLYFRPVALFPLIQAIFEIQRREKLLTSDVLEVLSTKQMTISKEPWINVLWEPVNNTMIMGNATLIRFLLMFLYGDNVLTKKESNDLRIKYASALNIDLDSVDDKLKNVIGVEN